MLLRAAAEQVGAGNLEPIHDGVSSKSLNYLAMPKIREFLHTLAQEVGNAAKK